MEEERKKIPLKLYGYVSNKSVVILPRLLSVQTVGTGPAGLGLLNLAHFIYQLFERQNVLYKYIDFRTKKKPRGLWHVRNAISNTNQICQLTPPLLHSFRNCSCVRTEEEFSRRRFAFC